jgi:zinc/manganese transport system substrate-binding protein
MAAQIGGRHVRVTSILTRPAADPHLYESDVANAVAVAEAGLVIENGAGYDDFLSQLLGGTRHSGRVVLSVQEILGATGPEVNPHFWYDIPRVPEVARAIEAALSRLEPGDAGAFAAGLAAFDASLGPIEAVIGQIRRRYPRAPVAYTERVPGYLLAAADLRVLTPPGFAAAIEEGHRPEPGRHRGNERLVHRPQGEGAALQRPGGKRGDPPCAGPSPPVPHPGGGGHRDHAAVVPQLPGLAARPDQGHSACAGRVT